MKLITLLNKSNVTNNTGITAEELEQAGYICFAKAKDKFLSGWGGSGALGHNQLVLCKSFGDARAASDNMYGSNDGLIYCNYDRLDNLRINNKQTYSIKIFEDCPLWNK